MLALLATREFRFRGFLLSSSVDRAPLRFDRMWHGTWRRLVSRVKKRFTTSFRHDPFSIPTYTAIRASNHTSPFSFSRFRPFPLSSPLHLLENSARAAFHSRKTRERRITEIHRGSKYRRYSIDLRLSFRSFPLRWILRGAEGFESCDFFVARWSATVRQPWIEFVSLRVIANFYLNWCMNFNRCVRLTFFIDSFAIDRRG